MKTFKEFTRSILMEHVVKGSLSGSPDGLLKVVTSADTKYDALVAAIKTGKNVKMK